MKKISRCNCLLKGSIEIPYRPAENLKSEIVFVFESPGKAEIEKGMMLIGASYKRLKSICDEVGLDLGKVFLANAARCKIDKDRFSQGQINKILEACRPKLKTALECSPRKLIVCFGEIAFRQVMKVKTTLKKARNNFYWNKEFNCWVYCTYHPAATLYYPNYLPLLKTDLRKVKEFIESGYKQEETIKWKEVNTIRPLLDGGFYKDELGCYVTAIDTETQGTAWYDPNSITISYSVAASPNEGWNVVLFEEVEKDKGDFNILVKRGGTKKKPIYVEVGIKKCQNFDTKVAELKELVARKDIKKYFMNIKYELHRFKNLGINEWNNCCFDVKVAAHVLDSELYKDVNLEELITLFTNIPMNHKDLVTDAEKEDMLTLLTNDRDRFNKYAALDAAATLQVGLNIRKELLKDKRSTNYYVKLAHPVESELLFEIERNGVCIDRERVWEIKKLIKDEMKKAELECIKYCPKDVYKKHKKNFKLSRGIIVREALFKWTDKLLRKNQEKPEVHDYGFNLEPILVSKKNGEPLIDKKKVLIPILQGNYSKKVKKFVQAYLNWGEYNKLLTNYIPNIEELSKYDGRLHPSASITFTSSGRTGFRKPALQTIPKRSKSAKYIRMLFKTTSDEYVLVEADYKVSELRWVAHVADDKQFQRIFKEGKDPHVITGLRVKGLPEDYQFKDKKERKQIRQASKPTNFGLIYGMMPPTLKSYSEINYGVKMTLKQAEEFREKWFSFYRQIPDWHRRSRRFLEKHGYLRSVFGRIRRLPKIYSEDKWVREQAFRTGINFEIQGPSSDATLLGGLNLLKDKSIKRGDCRIVLFIHDALIFEVKKDKLKEILPKIKYYMENIPTEQFGFKLKVPLEIEVEVGDNLSEMEEVKI